jgi:hypothetical protein
VRVEKKEKKRGGPDRRGPPVRIESVSGVLLPQPDGHSEREHWEEAALGELTGAAATGGEGAGRRRWFISATSSRQHVGGGTGLLGTRGGLRGCHRPACSNQGEGKLEMLSRR